MTAGPSQQNNAPSLSIYDWKKDKIHTGKSIAHYLLTALSQRGFSKG